MKRCPTVVEQQRARAAQRLGQERLGISGDRERRRVKLHGTRDRRGARRGEPRQRGPHRALAGLVVRSKQAPIPPDASTTCGASTASRVPSADSSKTPAARAPVVMMSTRLDPSSTRMSGRRRTAGTERPHDCGARAIAARVHDAVASVAGFAAERELAVQIVVECDTDLAQPSDAVRRRLGDDLRHPGHREIRGDTQRIGRMQGRGVVRADGRGDAALREP